MQKNVCDSICDGGAAKKDNTGGVFPPSPKKQVFSILCFYIIVPFSDLFEASSRKNNNAEIKKY